ncbi:MAG: hypothetical protein ACUVS7_16145, partial [Bryobacteraceae bacterium]
RTGTSLAAGGLVLSWRLQQNRCIKQVSKRLFWRFFSDLLDLVRWLSGERGAEPEFMAELLDRDLCARGGADGKHAGAVFAYGVIQPFAGNQSGNPQEEAGVQEGVIHGACQPVIGAGGGPRRPSPVG